MVTVAAAITRRATAATAASDRRARRLASIRWRRVAAPGVPIRVEGVFAGWATRRTSPRPRRGDSLQRPPDRLSTSSLNWHAARTAAKWVLRCEMSGKQFRFTPIDGEVKTFSAAPKRLFTLLSRRFRRTVAAAHESAGESVPLPHSGLPGPLREPWIGRRPGAKRRRRL